MWNTPRSINPPHSFATAPPARSPLLISINYPNESPAQTPRNPDSLKDSRAFFCLSLPSGSFRRTGEGRARDSFTIRIFLIYPSASISDPGGKLLKSADISIGLPFVFACCNPDIKSW